MKLAYLDRNPQMRWPFRFAVIALIALAANTFVLLLAKNPGLKVAIVTGSIPLMTVLFILIPMKREARK